MAKSQIEIRRCIYSKLAAGHDYATCEIGGVVQVALQYQRGKSSSSFIPAPPQFHAAARPLLS